MPSPSSNKQILALDIGATNTRIAIFHGDQIIRQDKFPTPKTELMSCIFGIIEKFAGSNLTETQLIVISVAGPVQQDTRSTLFPNIEGKPRLYEKNFSDYFSIPTIFINDATAAAYFESKHYSVADLVFITISTGIGVGVIKHGDIVIFDKENREIGHRAIDYKLSMPCACGGSNHWESYASGKNLARFYDEWRKSFGLEARNLSVQELYIAAESDDLDARDFIVNTLGPINKEAINNIIDLYHPQIISIGGPVVLQNLDLFLEGIGKEITKKVKIVFPSHEEEICLLGAATYALDKLQS